MQSIVILWIGGLSLAVFCTSPGRWTGAAGALMLVVCVRVAISGVGIYDGSVLIRNVVTSRRFEIRPGLQFTDSGQRGYSRHADLWCGDREIASARWLSCPNVAFGLSDAHYLQRVADLNDEIDRQIGSASRVD